MYESANYPADPARAEAFVAGQRHGTLIAVPPGGFPGSACCRSSSGATRKELHCVQADPTFEALRQNPRVSFLVSDYLTWTPHD